MRRSLRSRPTTPAPSAQDGFTMVEVLISAIVVVMLALATFGAITTASRTTAETRHRAQAYGVAQQDQARMRTFKVSTLSNYNATRTVTVDGTPYSITSQGEYVTDTTGTQTCTGSASPDYIAITSTVSWPSRGSRPSVVIRSIVSPPNGSIAADRGALAVRTVTSRNTALAGITIAGSGASSFSDITDSNGCVLFGNLLAGSYTLTPSSSTTYVDKDGNAPKPVSTSVVAQSTNTLTLQYDRPGTVNLTVNTRYSDGVVRASGADTVMAFNSGMTAAKRFGTVGTRLAGARSVGPLFPFTSPDTLYAGLCTANNPTAATPTVPQAAATVTIPVNAAATASIQLPALYLTVRTGSSSSSPGSLVANGRVTVTDRGCSNTKRVFSTNTNGVFTANPAAPATTPDPGLPYGSYDLCADNGTRRQTATNVAVKSLTGTTLTLYLSGTGSVAGTCP